MNNVAIEIEEIKESIDLYSAIKTCKAIDDLCNLVLKYSSIVNEIKEVTNKYENFGDSKEFGLSFGELHSEVGEIEEILNKLN